VRKPGDPETAKHFVQAAHWFGKEGVRVLVESGAQDELAESGADVFHAPHDELHKMGADFVVCFGGDGTMIRAAHAFPNGCPPILAFALGSLGFLTPFPVSCMYEALGMLVRGGFKLRLRGRLEFEVHRSVAAAAAGEWCEEVEVVSALNEAVIDRGNSSSLAKLLLYSNQGKEPVTVVQGDGVIIASPTGSTAYSLSAGGSMVHPNVTAILVTPISPFSLSFRPVLLPDSATLRIKVADDARTSSWISFDGRPSLELRRGDWVLCRYSAYPVPAVLPTGAQDHDEVMPGAGPDDWLTSIKTALHWNAAQLQKDR